MGVRKSHRMIISYTYNGLQNKVFQLKFDYAITKWIVPLYNICLFINSTRYLESAAQSVDFEDLWKGVAF